MAASVRLCGQPLEYDWTTPANNLVILGNQSIAFPLHVILYFTSGPKDRTAATSNSRPVQHIPLHQLHRLTEVAGVSRSDDVCGVDQPCIDLDWLLSRPR